MLSSQVQKDNLNGPKQIIFNPTETSKKEVKTCNFEEGEAYVIDVILTTSADGKVALISAVLPTLSKYF
jgi:hypothetical protein